MNDDLYDMDVDEKQVMRDNLMSIGKEVTTAVGREKKTKAARRLVKKSIKRARRMRKKARKMEQKLKESARRGESAMLVDNVYKVIIKGKVHSVPKVQIEQYCNLKPYKRGSIFRDMEPEERKVFLLALLRHRIGALQDRAAKNEAKAKVASHTFAQLMRRL